MNDRKSRLQVNNDNDDYFQEKVDNNNDQKTIFLTFSKMFPIYEHELIEFFTKYKLHFVLINYFLLSLQSLVICMTIN